jgi:prepilin-type N-terminal cleavage/methylation domain-containing protein
MDSKINRFKNGFTLIELVVVCAIIAILSAIGIPIYQAFQSKFKEESAQNNLRSIRMTQSEIFRDTNSYYPCPSTKKNSSDIDKEMFGDKGSLLKSEYDYEITGGCSTFKAYAYSTNSTLKCFSIDQNSNLEKISCVNPSEISKLPTAASTADDTYERICLVLGWTSCGEFKIYDVHGAEKNRVVGPTPLSALAGICGVTMCGGGVGGYAEQTHTYSPGLKTPLTPP